MSFCFMMKKDHFKQKLLLWTQFPFKVSIIEDHTTESAGSDSLVYYQNFWQL